MVAILLFISLTKVSGSFFQINFVAFWAKTGVCDRVRLILRTLFLEEIKKKTENGHDFFENVDCWYA